VRRAVGRICDRPVATVWPQYRGRDVLVVGSNVTGSEVANQLARGGAARVRVACRTVPNLVARKFLGVTVNVPGLALNHLPLRVADEVAWLMQRILFGRLDRYGLEGQVCCHLSVAVRELAVSGFIVVCPRQQARVEPSMQVLITPMTLD
jgi:cation diffusion facilitator CzcD-associated flavoprotein CzcO